MRKSFIVHNDSLAVLDDLTDEECGQLFKAIKSYQLGEETTLPSIIKIAFSPFKNQFIRDEVKYENIVNRNRNNGLKGGRPKNPTEPSGLSGNPKEPKEADSKSDSKSDSGNDSDNKNINPLGNDLPDVVDEVAEEKRKSKEARTNLINQAFDFFWIAWPTKKSKQKAFKSFTKVCGSKSEEAVEELTNTLCSDIDKRLQANDFGFDRMHATTYLNNKRWEDDISAGDYQ